MKQKKKVLSRIFFIILGLSIIYNFIFLAITTFTRKEYLNIFGIDFLVINNNLVVTREGDVGLLQEHEVIAYYHNGHMKIGSVNSIYTDPQTGRKMFSAKVENHFYPDVEELNNKAIIGRKLFEVKFVGILLKIIQSRVLSIFSIILLWWIYYYNRFKFKAEWKRKIKKKYKEAD